MPALGKTRAILTILHRGESVVFDNSHAVSDADLFKSVSIPLHQWREMDLPVEVTVTVEPGDQINSG